MLTFLREPIARAVSQYEHHKAEAVRQRAARLGSHGPFGDIVRVVSPQLCPQLEREARGAPTLRATTVGDEAEPPRPAPLSAQAQCATLRDPRKCRAAGWCGLFQNHQCEVLAGAQFAPARERARKRTSGGQLLAQARAALRGLPFFGLTEHLDASMCLLFDALS